MVKREIGTTGLRPEMEQDPGVRRFEEVAGRIRSMVDSGDLAPGHRLPSERTLAERFRVSRNSVREAIRSLAEQGLLETRRGDGTYVRETDRERLATAFTAGFAAQAGRIADIFQLRRMIEPELAFLAASKVDPQRLDRLKVLAFDQQRRLAAGQEDADLDAAFHLELAHASGNRVACEALAALRDLLAETRSGFLRSAERQRLSVRAHLEIIDALEARDARAAERAMREHLREVERACLGNGPDHDAKPATELE